MPPKQFLTPSKHMPVEKIVLDRIADLEASFGKIAVATVLAPELTEIGQTVEEGSIFYLRVHMNNLIITYGAPIVSEALTFRGYVLRKAG